MDTQVQTLRFLKSLFSACHQNPELKAALLQDPVATLEKLTGKKHRLPSGYSLKVEDQSDPNVIFLNIPPKPGKRKV